MHLYIYRSIGVCNSVLELIFSRQIYLPSISVIGIQVYSRHSGRRHMRHSVTPAHCITDNRFAWFVHEEDQLPHMVFFDHLLAMVSMFGLKMYQLAGADL